MPRMKVTSGPAAGQSFEVEQELVIGRDEADVTIQDPEISRRHALVRVEAGGVVVQDLDSRNGTFVNGSRITSPVTLTASGTIRLGQSDIDVEITPVEETSAVGETPAVGETSVAGITPPRGTVRRLDQDSPGAGPAVVADAALAEPAAPPRGQRRPTAPATERKGFSRKLLGIAAVVLVAAAGIAAALVLVLGGGETQRRDLAVTLDIVRLRIDGSVETLTGEQAGPPTGPGTVTLVLTFSVPPEEITGPTPISGELTSRFDGGSYESTFNGTLVPQQTGSATVTGDGTITGGTGTFADATGAFDLAGDVDPQTNTATLTLDGSIEW